MKGRLLLLLILLPLAAVSFAAATVSTPRSRELIDSLTRQLPAATPADSVRALSDLYDLRTDYASRDSIGSMLFGVALRAGDDDAALDILRNLANLHMRSDSLLELDLERVRLFKPSDDRDETATFIRMIRNLNHVRYSDDARKEARLRELLETLNVSPPSNVYDRIVILHAICLYIGDAAQGELLEKYVDRLGDEISTLRKEAYPIRNCYYVQAALYYRQCEKAEKAMEMDRRILAAIKALENGTEGRRRSYRNYDAYRYVVYSRLLSNYRILPPADVEEYYRKIIRITGRDTLARSTMEQSGRPEIYYAMFKKDYPKALRLLRKHIGNPYNAHYRQVLLRDMVECAEAVGDKETLLSALRDYNLTLEDALDERMKEKVRELEIIYDISRIKTEQTEHEARLQHRMLILALVAAAILLILLILMVFMYRRTRRLLAGLNQSNKTLLQQSHDLRAAQTQIVKARDEARVASRIKSDFIKNMSGDVSVPLHMINEYSNLIVDCAETTDRPYLHHFAECISFNAEVLTTIVNDVLSLSEIDSNTISIHRSKVQLLPICTMAIESVQHRLNDGVSLSLAPGMKDITVNTDPRRLSQILLQLLVNAAKFTPSGSITLAYVADRAGNRVTISVTDTGPGIKPDDRGRIFDRFVKLNSSAQGVGLGLPLARHLARLLGGTLILDPDYTSGARFILTIPIS